MSNLKLFKVACNFEYLAWATDEDSAKKFATEAFNDEDPKYRGFYIKETTTQDMPTDWTDNCCPYGSGHTLGQLKELVDLTETYRNRPEGFGFWVPDEIKPEPPKFVRFPKELVDLLIETVEATHDTNNDSVQALEILLAFYKRYSTELYNLAQLLEKSENLSEDDENMVRIFYGCKDNYHDFKDR